MLLDIKSSNPETYRRVTGRDLAPTLRFAERLASLAKPVWVRFTLVKLLNTPPASKDLVNRVIEQFRAAGCHAR